MREVELSQAFVWTCEACGTDQFERAVALDREQVEALVPEPGRDEAGRKIADAKFAADWTFSEGEAAADAVYMIAPGRVTCRKCGTEYRAVDP